MWNHDFPSVSGSHRLHNERRWGADLNTRHKLVDFSPRAQPVNFHMHSSQRSGFFSQATQLFQFLSIDSHRLVDTGVVGNFPMFCAASCYLYTVGSGKPVLSLGSEPLRESHFIADRMWGQTSGSDSSSLHKTPGLDADWGSWHYLAGWVLMVCWIHLLVSWVVSQLCGKILSRLCHFVPDQNLVSCEHTQRMQGMLFPEEQQYLTQPGLKNGQMLILFTGTSGTFCFPFGVSFPLNQLHCKQNTQTFAYCSSQTLAKADTIETSQL